MEKTLTIQKLLLILNTFFVVSILPLPGIPALSHAEDVISKDIPQIKDPEGIKRIEGSIIILGESKAFDEYVIPLQKIEFDYSSQKFNDWKKLTVEGQRDTVFYRLPGDVATLEPLRSYEDDLVTAGYEVLFKGNAPDLGDGYGRFMKQVYGTNIGSAIMEYHLPASSDFRYLAMKKDNQDGTSNYVTGLFAKIRTEWGSRYARPQEVVARIDIVRTKPLKNRLVLVKAEEMPSLLQTNGKIVLYGIQFEFNKAEVHPSSAETLSEVAKFLTANTSTNMIVTGHTDDVGTFDFNRDLSFRRAQSVVEYLVTKHNVNRGRLTPFGASFASPVAPNTAEDGKAKNRRVELVPFTN